MAADCLEPAILRKTDDFNGIRMLALESGLEDGTFDNIVCAFGYFIENRLVGCVAMKLVEGTCSVEWLAVKKEHRGRGLGKSLVSKVAREAKKTGAKNLWALARAPDFFLSIGFTMSSPEESPGPTFDGCRKCRQYNVTCFPRIVVSAL